MIKKKTIDVRSCDVCGIDDQEAHMRHMSLLVGMGYQCSNADPMGRKFRKMYKTYDVCNRCEAQMDHNFLGLSTEERKQIVYSRLMEYDNLRDLWSNPNALKWPDWADVFPKMDKQEDKQEDKSVLQDPKSWPNIFNTPNKVKPTIEEREFKYEGAATITEDRTW